MNNKGSDKNVANIEDDIKLVKRYLENSAYKETDSDFFKNGGWEMVDLEIPKAIEKLLQDYTRQKQINEEHKKINGELREKVRMLEEDIKEIKESIEEAYRCYEYDLDYSPFSKGIAEMIENILAEREQKDKRIQELEEQVKTLDEAYTGVIKESKKWFDIAHNSIPKQVVIEALNTHKFAYEELNKKYDNTYYEDDEIRTRDFYMIVTEDRIVQVLKKLLEGEK